MKFSPISDDKGRQSHRKGLMAAHNHAQSMHQSGSLTDDELETIRRVAIQAHMHSLDGKEYESARASGQLDQMQKLAAMDVETGDPQGDERNQIAVVHKVIGDFLDRVYELEAMAPRDYVGGLDEIGAIPEELQATLAELQGAAQEASWTARNSPKDNTPRGRERLDEGPTAPTEGGDDPYVDLAAEVYMARQGGGPEPVSVDPGEADRVQDEQYEEYMARRSNKKRVR